MSGEDDEAILQVLLDRLLKFRLPRALDIRKRVEAGECLTDTDMAFLKLALEDARDGQRYVVRNPQFHTLGAQITQVYDNIVSRAMQNEKERGAR